MPAGIASRVFSCQTGTYMCFRQLFKRLYAGFMSSRCNPQEYPRILKITSNLKALFEFYLLRKRHFSPIFENKRQICKNIRQFLALPGTFGISNRSRLRVVISNWAIGGSGAFGNFWNSEVISGTNLWLLCRYLVDRRKIVWDRLIWKFWDFMIKEMPRSETKKIRHPKGAKTQVKSKIVKKAK